MRECERLAFGAFHDCVRTVARMCCNSAARAPFNDNAAAAADAGAPVVHVYVRHEVMVFFGFSILQN